MGPRKFIARRITKFLLQHGSLDNHVRQIRLQQDEELEALEAEHGMNYHNVRVCRSTSVSSGWVYASMHVFADKNETDVKYLEMPPSFPLSIYVGGNAVERHETNIRHSYTLLVTSLLIVRYMKSGTKKDLKKSSLVSSRQGQLGGKVLLDLDSSDGSSALSRRVDKVALLLALVSFCLSVLLVTCTHLVEMKNTINLDKILEICRSYSVSRVLFQSSLWTLLVSILPKSTSSVWNVLNPANEFIVPFSTPRFGKTETKLSKSRRIAEYVAVGSSFGLTFWLSYTYLPIFHKCIIGTILYDFGFSFGVIHFVGQMITSFFAFCIFIKILPSRTVASSNGVPPIRRKKVSKFGSANPLVVQRMATLAQEAMARVEQRKKDQLNTPGRFARSYSVATFSPDKYYEETSSTRLVCPSSAGARLTRRNIADSNISPFRPSYQRSLSLTSSETPPPSPSFELFPTPTRSRHRSSLTSLPEHSHGAPPAIPYPPSPLLDIHRAGPSNKPLKSSGDGSKDLPKSIQVPFTAPADEEMKINGEHYVRSLESMSRPSPAPHSPVQNMFQNKVLDAYVGKRSNPQSIHTPVASMEDTI